MRFHFNTVTSTNDYAKELLSDHPEVLVTADFQSKGRGRKGKVWEGEYGKNLYLTKGLSKKLNINFENNSLFQAIACLSVKNAIHDLIPELNLSLKYPNDLYAFDGESYKKISGALIEQGFMGDKLDYTIIGIGVNIEQEKFPEDLANSATSIKMLGYEISSIELANNIDEKIKNYIKKYEFEIFQEWQTELKILNKNIEVLDKGFWKVHELLMDGRLSLKKENETLVIDNGDSVRYDLG